MLSPGIPDWVTWLSIGVTIAGFIVSVVGLLATYQQAKQAKNASVAAKDAALQAAESLRTRSIFSNIASVVTKIEQIKHLLDTDEIVAARVLFETCTGQIRDVFYSLTIKQFRNSTGYSDGIEITLKKISNYFDPTTANPKKKSLITGLLNEISATMSSEDAKNKWKP